MTLTADEDFDSVLIEDARGDYTFYSKLKEYILNVNDADFEIQYQTGEDGRYPKNEFEIYKEHSDELICDLLEYPSFYFNAEFGYRAEEMKELLVKFNERGADLKDVSELRNLKTFLENNKPEFTH